MAKFYGEIGFVKTETDDYGVSKEVVTKRNYYGDVSRIGRRLENGSSINDNLIPFNSISIVADPFANSNFMYIRYIKWMGAKWKISNVEVSYPRLNLTLGGLYNVEDEEI